MAQELVLGRLIQPFATTVPAMHDYRVVLRPYLLEDEVMRQLRDHLRSRLPGAGVALDEA